MKLRRWRQPYNLDKILEAKIITKPLMNKVLLMMSSSDPEMEELGCKIAKDHLKKYHKYLNNKHGN